MLDKHATFDHLLSTGAIRVHQGSLFLDPLTSLSEAVSWSRVEGMMLGLAAGDSLGNTSEGRSPESRRLSFGEVRDYIRHPLLKDERGYPSDDTQLAFWTLEQMLEDGEFDPSNVARRFTQGTIFGIGATVHQFHLNYRTGQPWWECGVRSAGNGSIMRIAPILIPHLSKPSTDLWVDTAFCTMITHNDSMAIASCVAFVKVLWELLRMNSPPSAHWWLETFVQTLKKLECDDSYEPRSPHVEVFRGPLWRFLERELPSAYEQSLPTVNACGRWYSGAYLLETIPCVLYILMRYGHEAEEAVVRAVNDTFDNDTVGAIVGAAVGALHGREALPERWLRGLSGRTSEDDDGRVFELLEKSRERWGAPA
jgi:ADP-ribosylglycohydrolase